MSQDETNCVNSCSTADYDPLAAFYDFWSSCDPASVSCWEFYAREVTRHGGVCLEVGVGTGAVMLRAGRIKHYYGVDVSSRMLASLKAKIKQRCQLAFPYTIIHCDARSLTLAIPPDLRPSLIIIPFRTIGHFITSLDKEQLLQHLRAVCAPDATCILDHYKFNTGWAQQHNRITRLMGRQRTGDDEMIVTDTYIYDFDKRQMECLIGSEQISMTGEVISKTYSSFLFSWLQDDEMAGIATKAGWTVERRYGGFDYSDFTANSNDQVWILRAQ